MEKMLTMDRAAFGALLKRRLTVPSDPHKPQRESFRFIRTGDFLLRSQLDCIDERLPLQIFDIKTRATVPVRLDVGNYQVGGSGRRPRARSDGRRSTCRTG